MKETIGFIGVGGMGLAMATNLVKAGFDVIGYNRSRGAIDALVIRRRVQAESEEAMRHLKSRLEST